MRKTKTAAYVDEPEHTVSMTDLEQVQAWYALAADSDNNHGQAELCKLYSQKEGIDWFLNAARNADSYAMYTAGKMYSCGLGVDQNDTKAATWFSKASAAGIAYAHYEMAKICHDGIGLDEDLDYAESLYKMALVALQKQEKQHPDVHAECILATLYDFGFGVEKDPGLAEYWRGLAENTEAEENDIPDEVTEADTPPIEEPDIPAEKSEDTPIYSEDDTQLLPELPKAVAPAPIITAADEREVFSDTSKLPAKPAEKAKQPHWPKAREKKTPAGRRAKPEKEKNARPVIAPKIETLDFLDMIAPSVMDFKHPDYFVCGNTFRCTWAIREYPTETEQLAILRELGEKNGITLHVYVRPVSRLEEDKILREAERRNRHRRNNARNLKDKVTADANIQDVATIINNSFKSKEILMHCAVFMELIAQSYEALKKLMDETICICARSKFVIDKLWLRQQDGLKTVMPGGSNQFGTEFERVIPSSSVGNLFPFSYSGKTDGKGFYIGEDVNGTNIIIDFDARSESKINGHIIILGNSGEGKSHLMHLLIANKRQLGKNIYIIDVENEFREQTENLGGSSLDMLGGKYFINVLEPRLWTEAPITDKNDEDFNDTSVPAAFRQTTRLSQHIAYLRDFFRSYKDFDTQQLDTLEILLDKLYMQFHITDRTDFNILRPDQYPLLSDLFKLAMQELENYDDNGTQLYTKDILRSLTLGIQSICVGAESKFFNGFTNITNSNFIDFSVMGLLDNTNENLKNAMFLNIFSWVSHKFLTEGDTDIFIDEEHMFVGNQIAVNYQRSFMKRGRKRNSDVVIASQNVEDLLLPGIVEYTKPLFSIPTHSFLFNPGLNVDEKAFKQALNVPDSEWELIKNPHRGHCLFRSGNERYHLHVIAPEYKRDLFGHVGGN